MNEFKAGEYIVLMDEEISDGSFSEGYSHNYCYLQKRDYQHLDSIDNVGDDNGWGRFIKDNDHNWRYATQEEINYYNEIGKPFDVTKIKSYASTYNQLVSQLDKLELCLNQTSI